MNYWKLENAENINAAIAQLPTAELTPLFTGFNSVTADVVTPVATDVLTDFFGVRVTKASGASKVVQCCKKRYTVLQHGAAFRPVIEALTVAGVSDFKFSLNSTYENADLNIYADSAGFDTVQLGINIHNSFSGHTVLQYGFKYDSIARTLELVGYRQICSNGMKIRVPLANAEIVKLETVEKINNLAKIKLHFRHTDNINEKLQLAQYITEALALLRAPVENMIKAGQMFTIADKEKLAELIKIHVGNRYKKIVLDSYANEPNANAWGLYNAITYAASHNPDLNDSARETLLDKGADLLLAVANKRA